MQYSPKLKMAVEEIKQVLDKYDIGGFVVVHTPGFAEFFNKINPSYSCARFVYGPAGMLGLHFKAVAEELGGIEQRRALIAGTYNLFKGVVDVAEENIKMWKQGLRLLPEHGGKTGGETSHQQQNN